jgi:hypothetical protein
MLPPEPPPVPAAATHIVVAAWECDPCDVRGRSVPNPDVECWNCGGPVRITAQPSIPLDEYGPVL